MTWIRFFIRLVKRCAAMEKAKRGTFLCPKERVFLGLLGSALKALTGGEMVEQQSKFASFA
jgi:hypothetical protein